MSFTPSSSPSRSLTRRLALAGTLALALVALPRPASAAPLTSLAPASSLVAVAVAPAASGYPGLAADLGALPTTAVLGTVRTTLAGLRGAVASNGADGKEAARILGVADDLLRGGGAAAALTSACPALADALPPHPAETLATLSATSYAPVPAALLLARWAPGERNAVAATLAAVSHCFGSGDAVSQDGTPLQPLMVAGQPLSVAHVGDVVALSTRLDLLRAAVRLAHGSAEPSLADGLPGGVPALSGPGIGMLVDTRALASLLEALPGVGSDPTARAARSRLQAAMRTVPLLAVHLTPAAEGVAITSWTRVDPNGGDADLARLLRCQGCRARPSLLTPASAVAVEASPLRLKAWTDYLAGALRDVVAAGGGSIDPLAVLRERTGVDLQADLFPWLGNVATSIRLPAPAGTPEALVGAPAQLTIVPVASADAARQGLARLGPALERLLSQLPAGGKELAGLSPGELVASRSQRYRGVDVTRIQIGPWADLGVALVGSRLVLANPSAAIHAVVDTYLGAPTFHDGPLAAALRAAPQDAQAVSAADAASMVSGRAAVLRALSQPIAFGLQTALLGAAQSNGSAAAAAQPASPPSLAALLTLTELPADALDAVAGHLGVARGWTVWQGGMLERHWHLPIH